jgi:hypothetical protein
MLAETSVAVRSSTSWFTEYRAWTFYMYEINNDGKVCLLCARKSTMKSGWVKMISCFCVWYNWHRWTRGDMAAKRHRRGRCIDLPLHSVTNWQKYFRLTTIVYVNDYVRFLSVVDLLYRISVGQCPLSETGLVLNTRDVSWINVTCTFQWKFVIKLMSIR